MESGKRFDVQFLTKQEEYSIPDKVIQVPGSSSTEQLNQVVKSYLDEEQIGGVTFDFLVSSQLLRLPLEDHLEEISASTGSVSSAEKVIEIEYFVKQAAPEPKDSLLHDDWVSAVDVCDQYILSGCYDGNVNIWSIGGKHMVTIPAHTAPVKAVRWIDLSKLPDAKSFPRQITNKSVAFLSTSHDETVKIWVWSPELVSFADCVYVCRGHTRTVTCADVNLDLIATGGVDCFLKIWSVLPSSGDSSDQENDQSTSKSNKKLRKSTDPIAGKSCDKVPIITLSGHSEQINGIVWMSDKSTTGNSSAAPEIVTASLDNTLRVWDIEVSEVKRTLAGSKGFLAVDYSPAANLLVTGSADRHVRVWDVRTDDISPVKSVHTSHNRWISCVSWSNSENYFVSGSYDNVVKYWDIRSTKAALYDLLGHKDKILSVRWHAPTQMIVSGSADNQVKRFIVK